MTCRAGEGGVAWIDYSVTVDLMHMLWEHQATTQHQSSLSIVPLNTLAAHTENPGAIQLLHC